MKTFFNKKIYKTQFLSAILLVACFGKSYSACSGNLDMGNFSILNVNNLQLVSINGFNYPTNSQTYGAILSTNGEGNLSWQIQTDHKLYYFMSGSPFGAEYDGTDQTIPDYIFNTNSGFYAANSSDLEVITNKPDQFLAIGDGTIKVLKPATYSIECNAIIPRNVSISEAKLELFHLSGGQTNLADTFRMNRTTTNSTALDANLYLKSVISLDANDSVGCKANAKNQVTYKRGAYLKIVEI